jgi:hypothetical protein
MTLRTAEIFVRYANWDENNIEANETLYALVRIVQRPTAAMG